VSSKDPSASPLYAGIAGVTFEVDEFDFGDGVVFRKTYAHIMAPYLAAFHPAERGKPHPPPWKAVGGGMGFDVQAQIYIPLMFAPPNWFDRLNTIWWLLALIRLRSSILATVPVIADKSFTEIPSSSEEPFFWPLEMEPTRLLITDNPSKIVRESDLYWIRDNWLAGGALMRQSEDFNLAFQAIDQSVWGRSASLAIVSLWGALERLFSPSHSELSFRVSATIASYLEAPGDQRLACYRRVKKLYDMRSKAAHGSPLEENESLHESYDLLKRALFRMMESKHVPSREELESRLFGVD
jgi:hypothetical protein